MNLKLDTLKDIALFRHLDMGELCKVLNAVRVEPVEAGGTVVREGEPGERLYAILEGHMLVSRAGKPVCTLGPGAHFGEMALFNNRPRSATVRAKESARLIVMERTRFNELLQQEPQLGVKLVWAFAQVLSLRLDETSVNLYGDINADRRDTDVIPPFRGERS